MVGVGAQLSSQGTFCLWRHPANQVCVGKVLTTFQVSSGTIALKSGGSWEPENSLTGHLPGSSGGARRLTGFPPSKIHPGHNHPASHLNSWRRGIRRARVPRGGSGKRGHRQRGPSSADPRSRVLTQPCRSRLIPWGGAGCTKAAEVWDSGLGGSLGGPTSLRVAGRPLAPPPSRPQPPSAARRGGGLLRQRGVPWLTPARQADR